MTYKNTLWGNKHDFSQAEQCAQKLNSRLLKSHRRFRIQRTGVKADNSRISLHQSTIPLKPSSHLIRSKSKALSTAIIYWSYGLTNLWLALHTENTYSKNIWNSYHCLHWKDFHVIYIYMNRFSLSLSLSVCSQSSSNILVFVMSCGSDFRDTMSLFRPLW